MTLGCMVVSTINFYDGTTPSTGAALNPCAISIALSLASVACAQIPEWELKPATEKTYSFPLLRFGGRTFLRAQWWTDQDLTTELFEEESGGNDPMASRRVSYWIKRESRLSGEVTFLQAPPFTSSISSRDGSLWALALSSNRVRDGNTIRFSGPRSAWIFRCDDFKTWKQIASFVVPENGYIGLFEVLDGNRFLIFGRVVSGNSNNEYHLVEANSLGTLKVHSIVKPSGLKEPVQDRPYFDKVARSKDFILHTALMQGWNYVFDAHTGAFLRLIRCYEFPKENVYTEHHQGTEILLGMSPLPDGSFLMACRPEVYANPMKDVKQPKTITEQEFLKNPRKYIEENQRRQKDVTERLYKTSSEVLWKRLDAATGEMKPIDTPKGGDSKWTGWYFTLYQAPNGSLRAIEEEPAADANAAGGKDATGNKAPEAPSKP